MPKKVHKLDLHDPLLEEKLKSLQKNLLESSPEHVQELGKILRRGSIFQLQKFLIDHGHAGKIRKDQMRAFRDYLITQRIDLKDLEPEARSRLRADTLEFEPEWAKTTDYLERGDSTCKHCQWFREKPPDEDKDCVELGAKGADEPCYGFTRKKLS